MENPMSKENALFPLVKDNIIFDTLWSQAMDKITSLSGAVWTDTGDHDPGITLLQAITWNCSDLSYRTSLSLNDLLTEEGQTDLFPEAFGPHNVLTCNTVTAEDYRKAIRDLHSCDTTLTLDKQDFLFRDACLVLEPQEKRFSWWYNADKRTYSFTEPEDVENEAKAKLSLRGNYWLYVLPTRFTQQLPADNLISVKDSLDELLIKHRNLGEKVSNIHWMQPAEFSPSFTIKLSEDVSDINLVVAQIFETLEELVLPTCTHQTTAQMQEKGLTNEDIFEGPFLKHGWQQTSLPVISEQGMTLNLSKLFNRLLEIPGVSSISQFSVGNLSSEITAVDGESWSWQIGKGFYPQLWGDDPLELLASADSPLTLVSKGGIHSSLDKSKLEAYLTSVSPIIMAPVTLPAGKFRDVKSYTPVGNRLPGCYQLQEPLHESEDALDVGIRELHQFLLPADQLLADGCAELAAIPRLLAFTGRESSNFVRATQWPYADASVNQKVHENYAKSLKNFQQQDAEILSTSNQLQTSSNFNRELDVIQYLLGYFGTSRAATPLTLNLPDFLETQRAYLAQQPSLGYDRVNVRIDKVSALQKRIAAHIGLNNECFAAKPDLANLPFYLVEHRQLLPLIPDESFNTEQTPDNFTVEDVIVTLTQKNSAGKVVRGQLIELIATEAGSVLNVGPLLVVNVEGDNFSLSSKINVQLAHDLSRLQEASVNKNLKWKNSDIWLQDMDYRLNYANVDENGDNQRLLSSSDQTPYPAMMAVGDNITITPVFIEEKEKVSRLATTSDWYIEATIEEIDIVDGTILITKADGSKAFPSADEAKYYKWNFTDSAYAMTDRFSFAISMVHKRSMIEGNNIDSLSLINWLQETIMTEFPAHISWINHWLSDTAFHNFATTYNRWQNNGNPLGDDAYIIMEMLTLGQLPVTQLSIGLMRIATETQRAEVMGDDDSEWNEDIISSEELFYVPKLVNVE
jgi:hypothetical protein